MSRRRGSARCCGRHADARHKLVLGHHPVHAVNGFSGPYQREIGPAHARRVLGRARREWRAGLPLRPHSRLRCAGPSRRAADLHRRRRHGASHAGRHRVPAPRAGRARRRWAALPDHRHRGPGARATGLAARRCRRSTPGGPCRPGASRPLLRGRAFRRPLRRPSLHVAARRLPTTARRRPCLPQASPACSRRCGSACAVASSG